MTTDAWCMARWDFADEDSLCQEKSIDRTYYEDTVMKWLSSSPPGCLGCDPLLPLSFRWTKLRTLLRSTADVREHVCLQKMVVCTRGRAGVAGLIVDIQQSTPCPCNAWLIGVTTGARRAPFRRFCWLIRQQLRCYNYCRPRRSAKWLQRVCIGCFDCFGLHDLSRFADRGCLLNGAMVTRPVYLQHATALQHLLLACLGCKV